MKLNLWTSAVFSLALAGGTTVSDSLHLGVGGFGNGSGQLINNVVQWQPRLAAPATGLTSLPFTFGWDLQAYAIGDGSASTDFEAIYLNHIIFLDAEGNDISGNVGYTLANGTRVADITPEPAPVVLLGSGLTGLLLLSIVRRRRAA